MTVYLLLLIYSWFKPHFNLSIFLSGSNDLLIVKKIIAVLTVCISYTLYQCMITGQLDVQNTLYLGSEMYRSYVNVKLIIYLILYLHIFSRY